MDITIKLCIQMFLTSELRDVGRQYNILLDVTFSWADVCKKVLHQDYDIFGVTTSEIYVTTEFLEGSYNYYFVT